MSMVDAGGGRACHAAAPVTPTRGLRHRAPAPITRRQRSRVRPGSPPELGSMHRQCIGCREARSASVYRPWGVGEGRWWTSRSAGRAVGMCRPRRSHRQRAPVWRSKARVSTPSRNRVRPGKLPNSEKTCAKRRLTRRPQTRLGQTALGQLTLVSWDSPRRHQICCRRSDRSRAGARLKGSGDTAKYRPTRQPSSRSSRSCARRAMDPRPQAARPDHRAHYAIARGIAGSWVGRTPLSATP
jgi:hypothetical protein